jgi:hypothetical protein
MKYCLSSIYIFPLNVVFEFIKFPFHILTVLDSNFGLEIIYTKVSSDFLQSLKINDGTVLLYGPQKVPFTPLQFIVQSNSTNQRYITCLQ